MHFLKKEQKAIRVVSWAIIDTKLKSGGAGCHVKLYADLVVSSGAKADKLTQLLNKIPGVDIPSGLGDIIDLVGADLVQLQKGVQILYDNTFDCPCKDITKDQIAKALEVKENQDKLSGYAAAYKKGEFKMTNFGSPTKEFQEWVRLHWKQELYMSILNNIRDTPK